jgi:ribonuclease T
VHAAGLQWDESQAHSAAYDAEITADVFCNIVNRFRAVFQSARPQNFEAMDEVTQNAGEFQK